MKLNLKVSAFLMCCAIFLLNNTPLAMAMSGDLTEDSIIDVRDAIYGIQVTEQMRTGKGDLNYVIYALQATAGIIGIPPNVVDSDGGTYRESNVALYLAPAAIPDRTEFAQSPAAGYPAYSGLVGTPVMISPDPLTFNDTAQLNISYDPAALPSGAQETGLVLAKLVDGVWTALAYSSVDTDNHTVTASVSGTGTYAVCIPGYEGLIVPPELGAFTASVSALAPNTPASVNFNWTYTNTPTPAPTAKLYPEGQPELAAAITSGSSANITISQDTTYILRTENAAGASERAVKFLTAAAPQITKFRISPAIIPFNTAIPVMWSWDYAENPVAECNCTVSDGSAPVAVANGNVSPITLPLLSLQKIYTLTCTNVAGSDSKTFTVIGLPMSTLSITAGPAGGTLELPNGIKLEIPEDALSETVTVTANLLTQFPADKTLIGMPFKLEPDGLSFNIPATLTIPYVQSVLDAIGIQPENVALTTVVNNEWAARHTTVDTTAGTMSALISHFSPQGSQDDYPKTPLRKNSTRILQSGEIAALLPKNTTVGGIGQIRDDSSGSYNVYDTITANLGYDKEPARICEVLSGDVNGDNKDDLVVVSLYKYGTYNYQNTTYRQQYIRLTVLDGNGLNVIRIIDLMREEKLALHDGYYQADIALGDVDGDGLKEIIVAGSYGRIRESDGSTVLKYSHIWWIFDDAKNDFKLLKKGVQDENNPARKDMAVASGDVDGDGLDEIIWMYRQDWQGKTYAAALIMDDNNKSFAVLDFMFYHTVTAGEIFRKNESNQWMNVETGDFDGDGRAEMIFCEKISGLKLEMFRYDANEKKAVWVKEKWISVNGTIGGPTRPVLAVGDFNGDGYDEAAVSVPVSERKSCSTGNYTQSKTYLYVWWGAASSSDRERYETVFGENHALLGMVAAGDTDRDGKDDLIFAFSTDTDYYYQRYRVNSSGVFGRVNEWSAKHDKPGYCKSWNNPPWVTIGDYDGDNIILEYTGESWDVMTDPIPIIAIAAPPVWGSLGVESGQNLGGSQSAYGTEVSNSTATGNEVGVSVGVTLSVEVGDPLGIVEVGSSLGFSNEFTKTKTQTESVTYGTTYGCAYPYDSVVYQQNHYRCYKYKIISHPNPKFAPSGGTYKFMTIDVPRKSGPDIYKTTLDTYNKNRGKGPEIGADVFTHTPGDIYTYPDMAGKEGIKGTYDTWEVPIRVSVGQVGGSTSEGSITLTQENSEGKSTTLGVEFTGGMSIGGVGFESSRGYSNTSTYEVSVGKSTAYHGDVGDIEDKYLYDNHKYFWGMFVYNYTPSRNKKFQVLNYWVEEPPSNPTRHALKFDGTDDYVQIPDGAAISSSSFTVELWFKADKIQTQKLATKTNNTSRWRVFMDKGSDNRYFIEFDRSPGEIGNVRTTGSLNPNKWYHIAAVYDAASQTAKIYRDGTLEGSVTGVADMGGTSTGGITIGKKPFADYHRFDGAVDDVRFWNYARSQAEIQGTKDTTLNGNESGLAGYWKFDDGSGTTAADSTSNINNGTLFNYPDPPGNEWTTFYAPVE